MSKNAIKAEKDKYKFKEGEQVMCFHGPLLYPAKCIKIQPPDGENPVIYFIHYNGWSKNWDEWVPEDRLLEYTEGNVAKSKELANQQKVTLAQKKSIVKPRKSSIASVGTENNSRSNSPKPKLVSAASKETNVASVGKRNITDESPSRKKNKLDIAFEIEKEKLEVFRLNFEEKKQNRLNEEKEKHDSVSMFCKSLVPMIQSKKNPEKLMAEIMSSIARSKDD